MPEYRAYLIGSEGRFAENLVDGHDVELWQRERKIEAFKRVSPRRSNERS